MIVYNSKKEKITLGDEISAGGEGTVYRINSPVNLTNYCIKIYDESKRTEERERKIRFMVANPPQFIENNWCKIGWPLEIIYSGRDFIGFMMPLAFADSKKLTILTAQNVSKRLDVVWQKYDRKNGVQALIARMKLINNLSIPIGVLHGTGKYVLQDFKPDNVLVTHNGMLTICDMDSIQICENDKLIFAGTAATPGYAPPEFTNGGVGTVAGQPIPQSWDLFAISVIFYQLLMGIHPFSVTPKDIDECDSNDISRNISRGLFPFGTMKHLIGVVPPPHNNFNKLPADLQDYFKRALAGEPNNRPTAKNWGELIHTYIKAANGAGKTTVSTPKPAPKPTPKPSTPSNPVQPTPTQPKKSSEKKTNISDNDSESEPHKGCFERFCGFVGLTSIIIMGALYVLSALDC